jgi:hypothetical protein
LISIAKVYKDRAKPNATPTAASTIRITSMIAKTIPRILAIIVAAGGNIPAIEYNMFLITRTIIPPTKLISYWHAKRLLISGITYFQVHYIACKTKVCNFQSL